MAAAAEAKKLDIIICKSISRFSRNMVDCQQYAKWFRTLGVTIIFEEQNIRTDDPTCDFVLSILAAVAQDESHSISENEKAAYVNIMFNSDLKRLVVKGCNENDRDALRWCIAKPDKRKSRKMSCRLFSELLYKEMDWSGDCRYKILGYRIEFEGEALYVFDLVAAEVFHERKKKQSADQLPATEAEENKEEQPVNPRKGYYPEDIAGTFGMPVEQHRQESELRQMDGFVSVGMLTGMPGQQQNL